MTTDRSDPNPGAQRHSSSFRLIRRISKSVKRFSAPARATNQHAFRKNEQNYSVQTITSHENEHINQRESAMSPNDSFIPSRSSLATLASMKSRTDSFMPMRLSSDAPAKEMTVRGKKIGEPMISSTTTSLMLQNYSFNQIRDTGITEAKTEANVCSSIIGDQRSSYEGVPASPTGSKARSTPLSHTSTLIESNSRERPWTETGMTEIDVSPVKYIHPRSQWTMKISTLLAEEQQTLAEQRALEGGNFTEICVGHHKHLTSLGDQSPSINNSFTAPNTSLVHLNSCNNRSISAERRMLYVQGQTICGPLYEEPVCNSEPVSSIAQSADCVQASWDSQVENRTTASINEHMIEQNSKTVEAEAQKAQATLQQGSVLSLANPLFHQALQTSIDDDVDEHKYIHNESSNSHTAGSEDRSLPDPTLFNVLSATQDQTASGHEMQHKRQVMVSSILSRSPDLWKDGTDDVDLRLRKMITAKRFW